ncbi:MAG: CxxC-x17-CxxC domain-containing protein [bacterium]
MSAFKKSGGFKPGGDRPRFAHKSFTGGHSSRGASPRAELFSATCSQCHKPCEVPFRPSSERPVFCRDCFNSRDTSERSFSGKPSYPSRTPYGKNQDQRPTTSTPTHTNELAQQIDAINKKLDALMRLVEGLSR